MRAPFEPPATLNARTLKSAWGKNTPLFFLFYLFLPCLHSFWDPTSRYSVAFHTRPVVILSTLAEGSFTAAQVSLYPLKVSPPILISPLPKSFFLVLTSRRMLPPPPSDRPLRSVPFAALFRNYVFLFSMLSFFPPKLLWLSPPQSGSADPKCPLIWSCSLCFFLRSFLFLFFHVHVIRGFFPFGCLNPRNFQVVFFDFTPHSSAFFRLFFAVGSI